MGVATLTVARTYRSRRRGLLGTDGLVGALWLEPCSSVHMVGMRYPIDVAVLDANGSVLTVRTLRPWVGLTLPRLRARVSVEAPAGALRDWEVVVGSVLAVQSECR